MANSFTGGNTFDPRKLTNQAPGAGGGFAPGAGSGVPGGDKLGVGGAPNNPYGSSSNSYSNPYGLGFGGDSLSGRRPQGGGPPMLKGGAAYGGGPGSGGGGTGPDLGGPLSGPGYYEDFYKEHGQDLLGTPSASESLYAQGAAASNPFYNYAQEQTTRAINDQSAARGNFNSSYTMKNIGNAVADLRGQQAHELGQLAGQADQGKFGRFDRTSNYADKAQGHLEDRAAQGVKAYGDLSRDQAGLVDNFYGKAGDEMSQANLAAIEAQLKASGMSAAETKAYMDFITKSVDAVVPG